MTVRDRILSRRAKFVAAAIATLAVTARRRSAEVGIPESDSTTLDAPDADANVADAKDTGEPQPCLSIAKPDDDPGGCSCRTPR